MTWPVTLRSPHQPASAPLPWSAGGYPLRELADELRRSLIPRCPDETLRRRGRRQGDYGHLSCRLPEMIALPRPGTTRCHCRLPQPGGAGVFPGEAARPRPGGGILGTTDEKAARQRARQEDERVNTARRLALAAIAVLVATASLTSFAESYRGLYVWSLRTRA